MATFEEELRDLKLRWIEIYTKRLDEKIKAGARGTGLVFEILDLAMLGAEGDEHAYRVMQVDGDDNWIIGRSEISGCTPFDMLHIDEEGEGARPKPPPSFKAIGVGGYQGWTPNDYFTEYADAAGIEWDCAFAHVDDPDECCNVIFVWDKDWDAKRQKPSPQ